MATKTTKPKPSMKMEDLPLIIRTKRGGVLTRESVEDDEVCYEPAYRERLDHYGNDGDGWDEDGWRAEYVEPLRKEVAEAFEKIGFKGLTVNVGEKGHVYITNR